MQRVASSNGGEETERGTETRATRVLLVDDEERFRTSLAHRLRLRGLEVFDIGDPEEAVRMVRGQHPDVIVLDRKMPNMDGEAVLREVKRISPETQVIMLTGHASIESATVSGRLEAFAYLEKPCETEMLLSTIEAARRERRYAMQRHEIAHVEARSIRAWLWGAHNFRPGILLLGVAIFAALVLMPTPAGLGRILTVEKSGAPTADLIAGYAGYGKMKVGETIAEYYGHQAGVEVGGEKPEVAVATTARSAKVMIAILVLAALFWGTGAIPIGITALLVGVLMYLFQVFPPDLVAKAYAKDAVVFIMGVLAMSAGIAKTGLDRRIGLLLLGTSRSLGAYLFLFLPMLAITAAFLSEHALVAFIVPVLMMVYMASTRAAGLTGDRALGVMLILSLNFAANQGGPGSPAAGGRNAVMISILTDYGVAPSFGQWVMYGLPFVPVMALVIATYFYLTFRKKVKTKDLDVAAIVRREAEKIGPMTWQEYVTAGVLGLVIVLWIAASGTLGMGGPVMLGIVLLAAAKIITWRDINRISWDVVALYAGACAMGVGLANTGAALWMADAFVSILPNFMRAGEGLCIAVSMFTGVLTNFMSDGATVSAIGPVAVPMAQVSGTHPWAVGFATAFASSFANCLVIGTPNNAIAYSLARDLDTGEQLVTLGDFMRHGVVVTLLAFLVLWGWAIFGYWQWIGFPS